MMFMAASLKRSENGSRNIALTLQVWREGSAYVAYTPELDISSCGKTASQAKSSLREAVLLFIEESSRQGILDDILEESGFERKGTTYRPRAILAREKIHLAIPAA
jgi:predicted RNase H-like HicB family nuclease